MPCSRAMCAGRHGRQPVAGAVVVLTGVRARPRRKSLGLKRVPAQQLVEFRPVALGQPRGLRDVALRHLEKVGKIVELEAVAGGRERQEGRSFERKGRRRGSRGSRRRRQGDALVDDVAKLANVAGPARRHQRLDRAFRKASHVDGGIASTARLLSRSARPTAARLRAGRSAGDLERNDVDAVVQIVAKRLLRDGRPRSDASQR